MTAENPAIVDNTFVSPRACGPCGFCCNVLEIGPPPKPADVWCQYYASGAGCTIRPTRPGVCRDFQCIWTYAATLDDRWRPDKCRFVMRSGPSEELVIDVDRQAPGAWRREPFYGQIKAWSQRHNPPHRTVIVRAGGRAYVVFPEGEIDLGPEQGRTPIQSGYVFRGGLNQPYAHYGADPDPPPAAPVGR